MAVAQTQTCGFYTDCTGGYEARPTLLDVDYAFVAQGKTCAPSGDAVRLNNAGNHLTLQGCAEEARAHEQWVEGSWFIYGNFEKRSDPDSDYYNEDRCHEDGCRCMLDNPGSSTCTQQTNTAYNLYQCTCTVSSVAVSMHAKCTANAPHAHLVVAILVYIRYNFYEPYQHD